MRRAIERVVREGTVVARSDGTTHSVFPVAISAEEGEALARRVARERPARPIEIGLGYGVAALFLFRGLLASGDESSRHLAIDPFQAARFAGCGMQLLEEAGVAARVEHRAAESQLALPQLVREGRSFDLPS